MIEEIKKEIKDIVITVEMMKDISKYDEVIFKVLDKYKSNDNSNKRLFEMALKKNLLDNCKNAKETYELSRYKNAWEELKEFNINSDWYINETQVETMKELIEELEQKYFIESWGKDE